jgi:hypothetical protein
MKNPFVSKIPFRERWNSSLNRYEDVYEINPLGIITIFLSVIFGLFGGLYCSTYYIECDEWHYNDLKGIVLADPELKVIALEKWQDGKITIHEHHTIACMYKKREAERKMDKIRQAIFEAK